MPRALFAISLILMSLMGLGVRSLPPPGAAPTGLSVSPARLPQGATAGAHVPIPAVDVGNGWETSIHVQNVGEAPAVAILELYPWPASSDRGNRCPLSDEASLLGTRRSPVIEPGTTWTFEAHADMGLDMVKSARLCSVPPESQAASCDGIAANQPEAPLAVTVTRRGPSPDGVTQTVSSYTALRDPGEPSPWSGYYYAWLPSITEDYDSRTSVTFAQNIGTDCAQIELYYMRQAGDPLAIVAYYDLLPGYTIRINGADIWNPPFHGQAWVRSTQPISVVVDENDRNAKVRTTYRGMPRQLTSLRSYAPLVVKDATGWNTEVQVQNGSIWYDTPLRASLFGLNSSNPQIISTTREIYGYDSTSISIGDLVGSPESFQSALRIEMEPTTRDSEEFPAALDRPGPYSIVRLTNPLTGQGFSYNPILTYPYWGATVLGLPRLVKTSPVSATTPISTTSRIVLQNLNNTAGTTAVALDFYGVTGVVGSTQVQLGPEGTHEFQLATLDLLPADFVGSALVRVTGSTQAAPAAIGAVVIEGPTSAATSDFTDAYEGVIVRTAEIEPPSTATPTPTGTPRPTRTPRPDPTATPTPTALPPARYSLYLPLVARGWQADPMTH